MKIVDGNDIGRGVNELLQGKSSCQTDGSAIRDCGVQEKPDRPVELNDVLAIGAERKEA